MSDVIVKFKLKSSAIMPTQANELDVGLDIHAFEDTEIRIGEMVKVPTGIFLAAIDYDKSEGSVFLKIESKSGLAQKTGVIAVGGIVDIGYRGEICVIMTKLTPGTHTFKKGDKVAQLLTYRVATKGIDLHLEEVSEMTESARGDRGFGSSGV